MAFRWQNGACTLVCLATFVAGSTIVSSQNTTEKAPPVIDVHVHAMDESFPGMSADVPQHVAVHGLRSQTKEAPFGWIQEECTPKLYPAAKGEYMKDVVAEMERLNVTAVVFGDPKSVQKWKDAAPARVIPGTFFQRRHDAGRARAAR